MSLLPTAGLAVDAASGLLLLFLGLYLLRLRPRQPRSTTLAVFSASLGTLFFLINLLSEEDALGPWLRLVGWLFAVPATAALILLAGQLAMPPLEVARRAALRQVAVRVMAAAVGGAALVALLRAVVPVNEGYPFGLTSTAAALLLVGVLAGRAAPARLAPGLRSAALAASMAAVMVAGHAVWFFVAGGAVRPGDPLARGAVAGVLYPLLIGGFCYALILLALRWRELARATEGAEARRSAVSATVALVMYPGLAVALFAAPWEYEVFLLAAFLAVPAVWLWNAQLARPSEVRTASNVGLLALGLVVLGAAAARLFGGGVFAVNEGPMGVARVVTVGTLAYLVLRQQIFDIDVKVKRAVAQGLIAAAFVAAFILGSQGSVALGAPTAAPIAGVAAMGLLGLGLGPLQRQAERLADAVLPGVDDSADYLNMRRLEVYRAALDQALNAEGRFVSTKAEAQLAELRAQLQVTDRDHAVLEHALRRGRPPPARPALQPGDLVLEKYRIVRLLGEGSFGRTHLAKSPGGDLVVLKMLRPDRALDPSLLREARAMGALRHPRVVALLGVEQDAQGVAVLVLEYIEGGSLAERLRTGPLSPDAFRVIALDTLEALEAVHASDLLHRDLKPSNILLDTAGRAKLADFGVARLPGLETTRGPSDLGSTLGTLRYMSPEQAKGRQVTNRSDLFSAAAALFEACTGQPYLEPKARESAFELQIRAASAGRFQKKLEGPPALRAWFARALAPSPERRFASARQMREALAEALPEAGATRAQTRAGSAPRR